MNHSARVLAGRHPSIVRALDERLSPKIHEQFQSDLTLYHDGKRLKR